MISHLLTAFIFLLFSCGEKEYVYEVAIKDMAREKTVNIKLDRRYAMQKLVMLENTANDTFMIGVMKVPPGKTGKLFDIEFLNTDDSLNYIISPYKATEGKIKYHHLFYNY